MTRTEQIKCCLKLISPNDPALPISDRGCSQVLALVLMEHFGVTISDINDYSIKRSL
jgi:hypothetical protein